MNNWLSATWEANWRSYQYFNFYRLLLAGLFFLAVLFPEAWGTRLGFSKVPGGLIVFPLYLLTILIGWLMSVFWHRHFNAQLSAQIFTDIVALTWGMHVAGGVSSGFGLILLVSLAAASLVGRGRLVLLYAAIATIGALVSQGAGILNREFDAGSIVQAGFLSAGYFATAILARLLGQRIMANEELARRRGIALDNQIMISQRVVERMQDGVLIVRPNGDIVRFNPKALELLGGQLEGNTLLECSPALAHAFLNWRDDQHGDSVQFDDGKGQLLKARFESTASLDGEVLIFLEDIERVQDAARQLKLASLGRLTASIAHEIRNPLSAISHAAELMTEDIQPDILRRLVRIISDNTTRLNRIVTDVLDLGRQAPAVVERIDLNPFCRTFAVDLLNRENLSEDLIELDVPDNLIMCFDRSHLNQVLWNLLSNALRFASDKPGAISVRAAVALDGLVELHIQDDGPGIPHENLAMIFEPFFTTHHQGTGLGLYIARELCAANNAHLCLVNEAGGGHFIVRGRSASCR